MTGEFEFINDIKSRYSLANIGDDCAVLPKDDATDLLLTADMLVEGIDFRSEWTTPWFLGRKALAVSLSDIAAMGGTPAWALLSIAAPEDLWNSGFLQEFYEGWHDLAGKFGVQLVGGDISRSPQGVVIDSIAGGSVPKQRAFLRSTARPGDRVFVAGTLGGSAGGLKLLEQGFRYDPDRPEPGNGLLLEHLQPQPQLETAKLLQDQTIRITAIDVSDGLSSDLGHICRASGVGAAIYSNKLPIEPGLATHFTPQECLDLALHGGEDFALLFTANSKDIAAFVTDDLHEIGEITHRTGLVELVSEAGRIELPPLGWRHF